MRLVCPGGGVDWALLDLERGTMRHLAGGLAAWAPRIAYGEGMAALPLNGRTEALRATEALSAERHFRRAFPTGARRLGRGVAAVVGAPPMGSSNPLRCIAGYVAIARENEAAGPSLGQLLVTAPEFALCGFAGLDPDDVGSRLQALDAAHGLQTGDLVELGSVRMHDQSWDRLWRAETSAADACGRPEPCGDRP